MENHSIKRIGPVAQKILLLLEAGIILSLTASPKAQFKIIKAAAKEWREINRRSLKTAIRRLYQSKLISSHENKDGTITLGLNEEGKKKVLRYNLDKLEIKKPQKWDNLWRIIIFDIPERLKTKRDALVWKLKHLGFSAIQKSVFIYPFACQEEIDFLIEVFELRPYVRFIVAQEIDTALELKAKFHLS